MLLKRLRLDYGGTFHRHLSATRMPDSLATIGKSAAVVDFGRIKLTGRFAWWLWGLAHIYFLMGLRHRLTVIFSWFWIYVTGQRSARLITQDEAKKGGIPV